MGLEHETIVVCRGKALLYPLNPEQNEHYLHWRIHWAE